MDKIKIATHNWGIWYEEHEMKIRNLGTGTIFREAMFEWMTGKDARATYFGQGKEVAWIK